MQSRGKYEYEGDNNKQVSPLHQAIEKDEIIELKKLLRQKVGHKLIPQNTLQYAARLGRWQCADVLIQHSTKHRRYYSSADYMRNLGEVLLSAAKENQTIVVKGIFELINLQRKTNKDMVDPGLLYCNSIKPNLRRDGEQAYTSLHWAVQNNNAEICELYAYFTKIPGVYLRHYGADAPIYRAKDKQGQTAFELAVSLGYTECAKKIAIGMSYEYLVHRAKDEVLREVSLKDIRLYFPFSGALDPDRSPTKKDYDSVKKMLFKHILELPLHEQQNAKDLMIRQGTALFALFNRGSSSRSEKYINQLIQNLHQEKTGIQQEANSHECKSKSSTSRLLKRLSSHKEESDVMLSLDDNPKPSVIVRITDKKDYPRTWTIYEDVPSESSQEEQQYTNRCSNR